MSRTCVMPNEYDTIFLLQSPAEATVLDAVLEKGRGVVADVLVQWGTLKVGDSVVIGTTYGKIRAMTDDR